MCKKTQRSILSVIAMGLLIALVLPMLTGCGRQQKPSLLEKLPAPPGAYTVLEDSADTLLLCLENQTLESFAAYRDTCRAAGYTEHAEQAPISYVGEKDGYRLELSVSKNILYITLSALEN